MAKIVLLILLSVFLISGAFFHLGMNYQKEKCFKVYQKFTMEEADLVDMYIGCTF